MHEHFPGVDAPAGYPYRAEDMEPYVPEDYAKWECFGEEMEMEEAAMPKAEEVGMRMGVFNVWLARAYDDAYLRCCPAIAYDVANAGVALWELYNLGALVEGPSMEEWRALQAQASADVLPY